ncbi:hypothetical protein D3C84_1091220 [compost metagenome]
MTGWASGCWSCGQLFGSRSLNIRNLPKEKNPRAASFDATFQRDCLLISSVTSA